MSQTRHPFVDSYDVCKVSGSPLTDHERLIDYINLWWLFVYDPLFIFERTAVLYLRQCTVQFFNERSSKLTQIGFCSDVLLEKQRQVPVLVLCTAANLWGFMSVIFIMNYSLGSGKSTISS